MMTTDLIPDPDKCRVRVERETRNYRAAMYNAIITRRDHPTYGYKKARITELWTRYETMLWAVAILHGDETAHAGFGARYGAEVLGLNYGDDRAAYLSAVQSGRKA